MSVRRVRATGLVVLSLIAPAIAGCGGSAPAEPRARAATPARAAPVVSLATNGFLDDSGYPLAYSYTAPIRDRSDLAEVYRACEGRSKRGIADLEARLAELPAAWRDDPDSVIEHARLRTFVGLLHMYDGAFKDAERVFLAVLDEHPTLPADLRANTVFLAGMASLRRGEVENCVACVGPSSCILPIDPAAAHAFRSGSSGAIGYFTKYLKARPEDLGARWLLNVANMTLATYPDGVPEEWRVPLRRPGEVLPAIGVGRFANVSARAGLDARGPNMFGGSVFDDFTGDGRPDVFICSNDWDRGASLFVNRGDGTFEDVGSAAGLDDQRMSQNAVHVDYDSDGRLDVLMLRGAWEDAFRMSLLRNVDGTRFEDVTMSAGLSEPIASQSAGWADYDLDGDLDLYVGGELHPPSNDPRNRSRLYRNNGNGTFTDVASSAGVTNERWAKGVSWGDFDDDGDPDLYVSNSEDANRLYRNDGDGTFTDVAPELGVAFPLGSFACWFWDYDNDGRLDLYVTGFRATIHEVVADMLGRPSTGERPRLYRNLGPEGFREVADAVGLDRVQLPMGSNFADVNDDGDPDIYLGTGRPPYSHLTPNVMLLNDHGVRFQDVSLESGTAHLQKGHGVSFADWDEDGDLDLFIAIGGTTPGDRAHNALFQNPGHGRSSTRMRLIGGRGNRSAIGARVRVELKDGDARTRSLYRWVGPGSSFGGNSLVVHVGHARDETIAGVAVRWPGETSEQAIRGVSAGSRCEITQGRPDARIQHLAPLRLPED